MNPIRMSYDDLPNRLKTNHRHKVLVRAQNNINRQENIFIKKIVFAHI